MTDSANLNWLIPTVLSLLATGLGGMVLLFMSGLRKDIQDVAAEIKELRKENTQIQVNMAKLQEQMYSVLRGDKSPRDPIINT